MADLSIPNRLAATINDRRFAHAWSDLAHELERAGHAVAALRASFPSTRPQHEAAGPDTDYCYGTGTRWSDLMSRIDDLAAKEDDRG